MQNAKKQTLLLTAVNTLVRAMGLVMRVLLSRLLGAEIMGITELCSSVHMLAITPLTSGLPLAVSRMTAKAAPGDRAKPLSAALWISRAASTALIPLLLLFSPFIARIVQDERILPSLWLTAPCILVLGYSASYNGYCYGIEKSWLPGASELIEQAARFALSIGLVMGFSRLTAAWLAAVPVLATLVAEIAGLVFVLACLRLPLPACTPVWRKNVVRLAAPTTATRLISTGLRSATALMLPLRLQASGLSAGEATARLGMLNGMTLPLVMLPCIFTSALSMVALPRFAKAEKNRRELKRLLVQSFGSSLLIGLGSAALLYVCAPLLAVKAYRLPELTELLRRACPLTLLSALGHISGGILAGLGKQKRAMYGTLVSSALSLALTYGLTALPAMRLYGALTALCVGQACTLLWNLGVLCRELRRVHTV
ncbi:MAG: oligosaccharide flippase family protein [Eubacteriales bacterium]|nr:oligosaccharide flippase family protein [Eubacteriales bacterium]